MLILGIETSGRRGSVALCRDGRALQNHRFAADVRRARDIVPAVDSVLADAKVDREQVEAVAVSNGPGSFTGLRVGVTCAKMLAYLLGWDAVGVPSLEVAGQNPDPARWEVPAVCPVRDARRSFVYATVLEPASEGWEAVSGVLTGPPEEVAAQIPQGALVFGSGVEAYPEVFGREGGFRIGPEELAEGRAEHVARLGGRRLARRGPTPPMRLRARYYRRTQVEEKFVSRSAGESSVSRPANGTDTQKGSTEEI